MLYLYHDVNAIKKIEKGLASQQQIAKNTKKIEKGLASQ